MNDIDTIDHRILHALQDDARTTQSEIASQVGLSQPGVADRIRKLEERGVIRGYAVQLDPRKLGHDVRAFIGVGIEHPKHHDAFCKKMLGLPEVLECHRVAGQDSYLLKVMTHSTETLDRLISDFIRRTPGVTRTQTTIVLSSAKEGARVPLSPLPERKRPAHKKDR